MNDWVTERNISQLREGSRGRLSNQDGGIPVNSRAVRKPDFLRGGEPFKLMPNGAWQVGSGWPLRLSPAVFLARAHNKRRLRGAQFSTALQLQHHVFPRESPWGWNPLYFQPH